MNNLQRLQFETKGIELDQSDLIIYLSENKLEAFSPYNPQSGTSKKTIYQSALSVLESIVNSPETMKNIKHEDMSVTNFATSIQSRIDQLDRKIRTLKTDEQLQNETNFFMLFES